MDSAKDRINALRSKGANEQSTLQKFASWARSNRKEDESDDSVFERFLESFMGSPAERGERKKAAGHYNEGGMAAEMDAVFSTSRKGEVDPVSGNEVPPGALPEEVRDDVDAKLSEGEYVVPADVLRYYGLKYFEDLRNKAKAKMEELDADGRIGGDPVMEEAPSAEGEEDLPFDIRELQVLEVDDETVAMAEGGLVGSYNEGGDVTKMETPDFLGGVTPSTSAGPEEYRTFTNAEGMTITVRFVNGKPVSYIPPGYTEAGTVEETTSQAPAQQQQQQSSGGNDDSNDASSVAMERVDRSTEGDKAAGDGEGFSLMGNPSEMSDEQLASALGNVGVYDKIGGIAAIASPVGAVVGSSYNRYRGRELAKEAEARLGMDTVTPESTKILSSGLDSYTKYQESDDNPLFEKVTGGYTSLGDMFDGGGAGKSDPNSNLMSKVTGGYTSIWDMIDGGGPGQSSNTSPSTTASTPTGGGGGNSSSNDNSGSGGFISGGGSDGVGNFGAVGDFFGGIGDSLGITNYSGDKDKDDDK